MRISTKRLTFAALSIVALASCGTPPDRTSSSYSRTSYSPSSSSTSISESSVNEEIMQIYRLYQENGGKLTYDQWLASIKGEKGEQGAAGKDGYSFHCGNGTPSNSLGNDGDTYLDLNNAGVFKKSGGYWVFQQYLVIGGAPTSSSYYSTAYSSSWSNDSTSSWESTSWSSYSTQYSSSYWSSVASSTSISSGSTIKVWCPESIKDLTVNQILAYTKMNPGSQAAGYTFDVVAVGEGESAPRMIADVEAGADIYFFAQDQLSRLVKGGALSALPSDNYTKVINENSSSSVSAATYDGLVYAYPATTDVGCFLYYDGSKLTEDDVKDWETIIAKAEAGSYEVDFNYSSAWYNFGFFYGAGADSVWSTDSDGRFTGVNDTYNTSAGLIAARAMANIITSSAVVDISSVGDAGQKSIALIDGTWDYDAAKNKWGNNLKCAELPHFTVNGTRYHTGSFAGNKLVGVKPQINPFKLAACNENAAYLAGEEAQEERLIFQNWAPSNKTVSNSDAIQARPQISALFAQNAYAKPQGQFPGGWWDYAGAIATNIQGLGKKATDAQLRAVLSTYENAVKDLLD